MRVSTGTVSIMGSPFSAVVAVPGMRSAYNATCANVSGTSRVYLLQPFDLSQHFRNDPMSRDFSSWSSVTGSMGKQSPSGASVQILYEGSIATSGSTFYAGPNKLRTSGTSVSRVSGSYMARISTPMVAPVWRLVVVGAFAGACNMVISYGLMVD